MAKIWISVVFCAFVLVLISAKVESQRGKGGGKGIGKANIPYVCNKFPGFKECLKNVRELCKVSKNKKCLFLGATKCSNRHCAKCDQGSLKELPLSMIKCTASSEYDLSNFACKFAISNPISKNKDRPSWATKNQNYGDGWIKLSFDVPISIKNVRLLQRYRVQDNVRKVRFEFDGGMVEDADLNYFGTYNWNKISIKKNQNKITKTLKITLTEVPSTLGMDPALFINPGFKGVRIIGCF